MFLSWDEDDQDKALLWEAERAKVCPGCGTCDSEWREDPAAYIGWSKRCPGCEALEQEREQIPEGKGKGVHVFLLPRAAAEMQIGEGDL